MSRSEATVSFLPEQHFRERIEARFASLRTQLETLIPGASVEHVGSTSISGSLTKGDLDVQIRVFAPEYAAAKDRLCELYDVNPGGFSADDAISFEDSSSEPHAGIHLTVIGGSADAQWRFRDLLRAADSLRREYDDLKRRFEGRSMTKYREAKDGFIKRVLGDDIKRRLLRQATVADVAGIQRVRSSVRENRLVSTTISDDQVRDAIERTGRGWVIEVDGEVVAFAIGNATNGNVWALFVDPRHERRGYGRVLHDAMVEWLWSQGLERVWLTTAPGTRAQSFYEAAGWQLVGVADHGEVRYERSAPF